MNRKQTGHHVVIETMSTAAGEQAAAAATTRPRPRITSIFETALIIVGLAGFGFALPHYAVNDAMARYENLKALLDHGQLVPSKFTIVGHLFAAPLIWAAKALGQDELTYAKMYNSILLALAVLILHLLLRRSLEAALLRRFFLVLTAGSMFAAHVVHFNSEPFTALAVAVGLTAVAVRGRSTGGWTLVVLGVANTTAAVVGLAFVVAKRAWQRRHLRYVLALFAVAAIAVADNWLRRGGPFNSGYAHDVGWATVMPYSGRPGFSYPIFFGLLALFFAFGKGLLFFAPGLLLPVRASMRRLRLGPDATLDTLYVWWLLFLAGLILAYAPWWAWYGGLTWGPRFLLFAALPASLALAVRLHELTVALWQRVLTLVVWAMSVWVGLTAAVFPEAAFPDICWQNRFADEQLCNFTPEFSVLWYPVVAKLPVSTTEMFVIGYLVLVFCYLAWPLCRSIAADLARKVRRPLAGSLRGWRW